MWLQGFLGGASCAQAPGSFGTQHQRPCGVRGHARLGALASPASPDASCCHRTRMPGTWGHRRARACAPPWTPVPLAVCGNVKMAASGSCMEGARPLSPELRRGAMLRMRDTAPHPAREGSPIKHDRFDDEAGGRLADDADGSLSQFTACGVLQEGLHPCASFLQAGGEFCVRELVNVPIHHGNMILGQG